MCGGCAVRPIHCRVDPGAAADGCLDGADHGVRAAVLLHVPLREPKVRQAAVVVRVEQNRLEQLDPRGAQGRDPRPPIEPALAAQASRVVCVTAGLPQVLKGTLP